MSDNDHIDPALLSEDNPEGLQLRPSPGKVKKLNKKGLAIAAGGLSIAAIIAALTFNQGGKQVTKAAGDAVASQNQSEQGHSNAPLGGRWYNQEPDSVVNASSAPAPTLPPKTAKTKARKSHKSVPDLTGQAVPPIEAATAAKTQAPALGSSGGRAGQASSQLTPEEQQQKAQAQQKALQQQEAARTATLSVQGFGGHNQAAPTPASLGGAGGNGGAAQPVSYQTGNGTPVYGQGNQHDPNMQRQKDQFMKNAQQVNPNYSSSSKTAPRSRYEVKAGSVIPAVLVSGINSDLPGQIIGQVRENVYDSRTGQYLLIPQGSKLVGLYDSHVAYGQERILVAWNRIIYPDGSSFDLKGMPGTGPGGLAGFSANVNNHYLKIFGSAALMSVISAGVQLSQPNNGSSSNTNSAPSVSQTLGAALGQQIGQTAMTITQKNLNIQPTLTKQPGYLFNVMVTADMILPPHHSG